MNVIGRVAAYERLREQPALMLLNGNNLAEVAALLATILGDTAGPLPYSLFVERVARGMDDLRAAGFPLPQSADHYRRDWLRKQWIAVTYPEGAAEELVSLTAEAALALRFLKGLEKPKVFATGSRLQAVIQQLTNLARESDPNPETRLVALRAERDQIDREIAAVEAGQFTPLSDAQAQEQVREILMLADDLVADFQRVREDFAHLNQQTREQIVNSDMNRGQALEEIMQSLDKIDESEAGRTFSGFLALFRDIEQSSALGSAIDAISERPFMRKFTVEDRSFLRQLQRMLLEESLSVQGARNIFAKSLKTFVKSREFMEHRRISSLLKEAMREALEVRDQVQPSRVIRDYEITRTTTSIDSITRSVPYDLESQIPPEAMKMVDAPQAEISIEEITRQVMFADIDYRGLKTNVVRVLEGRVHASIGEVLEAFPARQGLASVAGLMALASQHGHVLSESETIRFTRADGVTCAAEIPTMVFTREKAHGLSGAR